MSYDRETLERARAHLHFLLRQLGAEEPLPIEAPSSPYLRALVDKDTAQRLYSEIRLLIRMMTPEGMDEVVKALVERGYSREFAEDYAARLGDTIEEDANGKWMIRDDGGQVIARIEPIV